jgi:hypothetical protein
MFSSTGKLAGAAAVVGAAAVIGVPGALAQNAWFGPSVTPTSHQAHTSVSSSLYLRDSWYLTVPASRVRTVKPRGSHGLSPASVVTYTPSLRGEGWSRGSSAAR